MSVKQGYAAEDSAALIEDILKLYIEVKMPELANRNLHLGIPYPVLWELCNALHRQHSGDGDKRFYNRLWYAGIFKERTEHTFQCSEDTYPLAEPATVYQDSSVFFRHF